MKFHHSLGKFRRAQSPPARGAWIEIHLKWKDRLKIESPPARGAWIEICTAWVQETKEEVAPREGGVD
mgnify:CR=1 FL=1